MTALTALRVGLAAGAIYLSRRRPHSRWLIAIPIAQGFAAIRAALRNKRELDRTGTVKPGQQAA